jgi:hypothetical protein
MTGKFTLQSTTDLAKLNHFKRKTETKLIKASIDYYDFLAACHHRQTLCFSSLLFPTTTKGNLCANDALVKCFKLVG